MARKKKTEFDTNIDPSEVKDHVAKVLHSEFKGGEGLIIDDFLQEDPIVGWVSTSAHMLDLAIGYPKGIGLPLPAIVEIVGIESTGKSLLAYTVMGNIQEAGGWAMLIDTEAAFNHSYAKLARLDVGEENFLYCQFDTIEDCFNAMKLAIEHHQKVAPLRPFVICLDSVAGTTTTAEKESHGKETARALHARIIRRELREWLVREISGKPIIVLFTNQLTSTMATSPWEPKYESFGGSGLKFYSKVRIQIDRRSTLKRDKDVVPYGIRCRAKIIKNKIAPPFREAEFDIRFASGVEDYYPVMNFLEQYNQLPKGGGGRYTWGEKTYFAAQLRDYLILNQGDWNEMKKTALATAEEVWLDNSPITDQRKEIYDSITGEVVA